MILLKSKHFFPKYSIVTGVLVLTIERSRKVKGDVFPGPTVVIRRVRLRRYFTYVGWKRACLIVMMRRNVLL